MNGEIVVARLPAEHPCAECDVRLRTFCRVLDNAELARFRCEGTIKHLEPKQPLFHEGDPADVVYNLTEGSMKLYKLLPDGRRQVTGFLFPGDFLGLSVDSEHAFTAEALDECEMCRFPRNRFEQFIEEHPEMEHELLRMAAHELAAAQDQMVLLGRKTATERVASFLLDLHRRALRQDRNSESFRLAMSRTDIADYLGLTKETVSRAFTWLKTRGLIRLLPGDAVRIVDARALTRLAGGLDAKAA
jgi:CRP/FNR family transcriptional regulator